MGSLRAFLRRRCKRKATMAMMLRTLQPPIVPPTIAPRFVFAGSVLGVRVGELDGEASTVTVTTGPCGIKVGIVP